MDYLVLRFTYILEFFFFGGGDLCPWHVEVPRPGIKPTSQQWPKSQQWQHWILNSLSHQGTPWIFSFVSWQIWEVFSNYFFSYLFHHILFLFPLLSWDSDDMKAVLYSNGSLSLCLFLSSLLSFYFFILSKFYWSFLMFTDSLLYHLHFSWDHLPSLLFPLSCFSVK